MQSLIQQEIVIWKELKNESTVLWQMAAGLTPLDEERENFHMWKIHNDAS